MLTSTADHFWVFDTLKKIGGSSYINDERGNIHLKKHVQGSEAGVFEPGENAQSESLPIDDCLSNLALCSDGLSIAFALKGK